MGTLARLAALSLILGSRRRNKPQDGQEWPFSNDDRAFDSEFVEMLGSRVSLLDKRGRERGLRHGQS